MKLTDGKKTVEITIRRWDGNQWGEDWSRDYFSDANDYDEETDTYTVPDVDYCIDMANSTDQEGARCKYDLEADGYVEDEDMGVWVEEL